MSHSHSVTRALARLLGPGSAARPEPFAPEELAELRQLLARTAAAERAALAARTKEVVVALRGRTHDLLGGHVDEERGSARLQFAAADVVVASADVAALGLLVHCLPSVPVRLIGIWATGHGGALLVFAMLDWTVVVTAQALLFA